ncbi:Fic family protein [Tsukamurella sp. NPDC003166]|uniref:Fic family protein n=1 Tax=Tsukamurella sp. NPDC003166 TaxID=3154444 RepID=UPI0033BA45E0
MAYRTLKSVFYQRDAAGADSEERARRTSPAAISWDFELSKNQLFCMTTPYLSVVTERIMSLNARAEAIWATIPPIAQSHYFSTMIVEEIQATNEIEQVNSSRREITDALRSLKHDSARDRRFREMVRLYAALGDRTAAAPTTLDDIRAVYDNVTRGEVDPKDSPDGDRFRAGIVEITSGQRVLHRGLVPEQAIASGLTVMLAQRRDDGVPHLIRAAVSHLIFEVVHPFYDGNGRTGRFLLALDLAEQLSPVSWFSLSATIFENRDRYYRAFTDLEHPLNRADATPFIEVMLEIIAESLHRVTVDLSTRRESLERLHLGVRDIDLSNYAITADDDLRDILFALGQAALFDIDDAFTLNDLTAAGSRSKRYIRDKAQTLVDAGLVDIVSRKPLRFRLSTAGRAVCAIDDLSS